MTTDFDTDTTYAITVSVRVSQGMLNVFQRSSVVDTCDLGATRATVKQIVSECLYTGIPCTEPQALAAAFSVPDGSPLALAMVNVGPGPSVEIVKIVNRWMVCEAANNRAFRRGPRF